MKKMHFVTLYIIILVLFISFGFMLKLINDKPTEKIVYLPVRPSQEIAYPEPITEIDKPLIPVEPYLIQQYCQKNISDNNYDSRTKNWDIEVWNEGFINYTCKKNPGEGFAVGVLCSDLFNRELFTGRATNDQKNCKFEVK
jgi:hypothetical protein